MWEFHRLLKQIGDNVAVEITLDDTSTTELIALAKALQYNSSLKSLTLITPGLCHVGKEAFAALSEALKLNSALLKINFCLPYIVKQGVIDIAEGLKVNSTLTTLDLFCNFIHAEGAIVIAEVLKVNSILTTLNLSYN